MKRIFIVLWVVLVSVLLGSTGNTGKKIETPLGFDSTTVSGFQFRNIGPSVTSGRISDIVIHPKRSSTWYVAAGSGNVWKTTNMGTNFIPVFDHEKSYSIGCLTLDPSNPETVWIGTGENVSGRHVGFGDGVYRSLNGGETWENMGLRQSEHISKILVDPRNSNTIFAASEGPLWSAGGERGLYKSIDGGKTWNISLFISKDTGVCDAVFEPGNPDIIYASAYQRRRNVAAFMGGGPESGIFKSTDGGKTWKQLIVGLPKGDKGRIGLAVSPIKPEVVYATVEATPADRGFYRSENRGESWEKRNSYISGGTGPHYYQEIFADPHRFDRVYQMDVWMMVTDDGGTNFRKVGETTKHSDSHALAFMPGNPDFLVAGCDGGVYTTWDLAKTWMYASNLPVTQFYKLSLDNTYPFYNIIGGAQDNGTLLGPSRTMNTNGIFNGNWISALGADGYSCAFDPGDPNIIYASWQTGNLSRYDKKTGEEISIQPRQEKDEPPSRWNWDSPLLVSPHSNTRIYYASQRLYWSDNRGDSWTAISPDLSRNIPRLEQPIMGKTWSINSLWHHEAMSYYGNICALSESPLKEGLIYAGTDDGLIRVTEDGGKTWSKVENLPGVPSFFFVNDIKASLHDINTVYVAVDNHKNGDYTPYLLKSSDRGKTWSSITGDLEKRNIIWSFAQDHIKPGLLFIGTEFGIYFTLDEGKHWVKFTGGLPTISFRGIEIQKRENDLVGASFGRGFFVLDDYSPLRELEPSLLNQDATLFPARKTLMYIPKRPFDLPGKAFQGDDFFIAPNPPYGAVFTYYLKDSLKTGKETRLEVEKNLEKQGKSISFPGWDNIKKEDLEAPPSIILTVKDENGQVVRRINGPITAGINRVSWDLRYPNVEPTILQVRKDKEIWDLDPVGPLVSPGTYTVTLSKCIDGKTTLLSKPQAFVVESLAIASLPAKDQKEVLAFQQKAGKLMRAIRGSDAALTNALEQIKYMKKAFLDTPDADPNWSEETRKLELTLLNLQYELLGNRTLELRTEPSPLSIIARVNQHLLSTAEVTTTTKHDYEIAAESFAELLGKIKQAVDVDLKKLEDQLEAAGAPWTPGRRVPDWNR